MKKMILLFLMPISPKLAQYTDADLAKYIGNIIINVLANAATFVNSAALIPALKLKMQEFEVAYKAVKNGPAGSAAAKDAMRVVLENMFNQMAVQAWAESNNDIAVFKLTGIDTRKPSEHISSIDTPTELVLEKGMVPNSLQLKFKKVKHVLYYKMIVTHADGSVVKEMTFSSSRKTVITGLTRGSEYFVKVAAFGHGDLMSDWSSMVNSYCS